MIDRRSLAGLLSLSIVPVLLSGCGDEPDPGVLAPEVAAAPGGEKGKPGGKGGGGSDTRERTLEEYFITEIDGVQHIHVVASGPVDGIHASTMLDHFHNGFGDDDPPNDTHYEYYLPGSEEEPPHEPVSAYGGAYHVDIPFAGSFLDYDPDIEDYVRLPLPAYPYMNVDGLGGDPWVFRISLTTDGSDSFTARRPGELVAENAAGHDDVRPFVVHQGAAPAHTTWVESLDLDNASCRTTTVRSGKGKNRTVETYVEISGEASFTLGASGEPDQTWVELHLMDVGTGMLGPRRTTWGPEGSGEPVSLQLPEGSTGTMQVVAVIDYVYANPVWGVYDPAQNQVSTTAGASSDPFVEIAALGDPAPFARSQTVTVDCS